MFAPWVSTAARVQPLVLISSRSRELSIPVLVVIAAADQRQSRKQFLPNAAVQPRCSSLLADAERLLERTFAAAKKA